ncbi:MAG: polyribonucleotide nucleotidyltransferase [Helicobacteraceae bacterium]|jgi:polyribonucleotide nucleotidyltransferase|nr:polyribonucleotide nucleotidyltransferase [Helicobacteraceae bacterium]
MSPHIITLKPNREEERYQFGKVARQADGAVWLQEKGTVLIATVTYEDEQESEDDFLPLTVQYIEKTYAAGKFPGGFIKRENKPSDFETLTARIVDRTIRPLFPKGFTATVLVAVTVLSCDEDADLQRLAVLAAQAALFVSSLPARKALAAVRVGLIDGAFIINPTTIELGKSSLDLFVCGSAEELLMIEMRSLWSNESEIDEKRLLEAISLAFDHIAAASKMYEEHFRAIAKPIGTFTLKSDVIDESISAYVEQNCKETIASSLSKLASSERGGALNSIAKEAARALGAELKPTLLAVEAMKRRIVREAILRDRLRADGRALDEIRPITIETNILPKAHSSALFTRGQTQALVIVTLGSDSDRQSYELLTSKTPLHDKLILHYNFPGFSVGETKRIGAPGRRELGHGNLAKRAIESQIDPAYENTIRIVSEILESNGSSSMATVCGATVALKAAAVPMRKTVAGVAMGLVTSEDRYAILTDITGLEDHDGDMDFKVAGTQDGITALQMDIKLGGLPLNVLGEALAKAKEARLAILSKIETACESIVFNTNSLPSVETFKVDPKRMVDIIGKAGATIRDLIERFDVTIDLDREHGGVKVRGSDSDKLAKAISEIHRIADEGAARSGRHDTRKEPVICKYTIGEELQGKIVKIVDFGLFVELPDGSQGLVHISKVGANGKRVAKLTEHFKEGDTIVAIFEGQDERKKIALNIKDKIV